MSMLFKTCNCKTVLLVLVVILFKEYSDNLFRPCDVKRETETSCEDWNDRSKKLQGKTEKMMEEAINWLNVGRVTDVLKARRDGDV